VRRNASANRALSCTGRATWRGNSGSSPAVYPQEFESNSRTLLEHEQWVVGNRRIDGDGRRRSFATPCRCVAARDAVIAFGHAAVVRGLSGRARFRPHQRALCLKAQRRSSGHPGTSRQSPPAVRTAPRRGACDGSTRCRRRRADGAERSRQDSWRHTDPRQRRPVTRTMRNSVIARVLQQYAGQTPKRSVLFPARPLHAATTASYCDVRMQTV
jgi:hypothetical protein